MLKSELYSTGKRVPSIIYLTKEFRFALVEFRRVYTVKAFAIDERNTVLKVNFAYINIYGERYIIISLVLYITSAKMVGELYKMTIYSYLHIHSYQSIINKLLWSNNRDRWSRVFISNANISLFVLRLRLKLRWNNWNL